MPGEESGFSLMEVIVAMVIATIAVVGLAYTFGMGRGFINRFEVGRAAVAAAQARLEGMASVPVSDTLVTAGGQHACVFEAAGRVQGMEYWTVQWIDLPADSTAPADPDPNDLRLATVTVTFVQGGGVDSVHMTRLLPPL